MKDFNPEQGDMIEVSDDIDTAYWVPVPWEFICMRPGGYLCVLDEDEDQYFCWPYARAIPKKHLPKDILCWVGGNNGLNGLNRVKRYTDGKGNFFQDGTTSSTATADAINWDNYEVVENDPQPWFGGECPIPEGCTFKVYWCGKWSDGTDQHWDWGKFWDDVNNITAYQITGEIEE